MPALPTIQVETMLLGWQRSHNGGSKIILQVPDDDLVHFEKMTVKKGKVAGQRLACVFVEIGDDERPVPQPATVEEAKKQAPKTKEPGTPLGALSKWVVMRCQDAHFQGWLRDHWAAEWDSAGARLGFSDRPEDIAKELICTECGIASRKELDTNETARAIFDEAFRHPYAEACK